MAKTVLIAIGPPIDETFADVVIDADAIEPAIVRLNSRWLTLRRARGRFTVAISEWRDKRIMAR
jgi:hypothetical protein